MSKHTSSSSDLELIKLKDKFGITEEIIKNLVDTFYSLVRADPMLGPIFNNIIGENWDHHLTKLYDFWSSIALGSNRYKGQPMATHIKIPHLSEQHFKRWLELFYQASSQVCQEETAKFFTERAEKIAKSLIYAINFYNNKLKL